MNQPQCDTGPAAWITSNSNFCGLGIWLIAFHCYCCWFKQTIKPDIWSHTSDASKLRPLIGSALPLHFLSLCSWATEHTFLEVIVSVLLSAAGLEFQWLPSSTGSWTKPQNSTRPPQWSQSTMFSSQPAPSLQVSPGFPWQVKPPRHKHKILSDSKEKWGSLGSPCPRPPASI